MARVIVATMGAALAQVQGLAPASEAFQPGETAPASAAPSTKDATAQAAGAPLPKIDTTGPLAEGESLRVGGDTDVQLTKEGDNIRSGTARCLTPLPVGYPAPTPPGAMEIKSYPAARRAVVTMKETGPRAGGNIAFWPLFNHIKKRDIEMTAPVEMDLKGMKADGPMKVDEWSMAFLYRRIDQGPEGKDGIVEVYDSKPMTVLAMGYQGDWLQGALQKRLGELEAWLDKSPEWERAGEVRVMGYNGPEVPSTERWAEIQVPIKRSTGAKPAAEESPKGAPSAAPAQTPASPSGK
jgi:hypothetical protein